MYSSWPAKNLMECNTWLYQPIHIQVGQAVSPASWLVQTGRIGDSSIQAHG
jgi:hypothetical protein